MRAYPDNPSIMHRTFDATLLNSVANADGVREWLGGEGAIDMSPLVSNPANHAMVTDGGGFLFICHEPGVYEAHSMFLPEARRNTVGAMVNALHYMFAATDCYRVLTLVPDSNRGAISLAKRGHFRELFRRDGALGPASYMALDIDDWAQRCGNLEEYGQWFHEVLEAAESEHVVHADDPSHDKAVGACVAMIMAGNIGKGVAFYNRWAAFAGYMPIRITGLDPLVVDIGDAVVEVGHNNMRVL